MTGAGDGGGFPGLERHARYLWAAELAGRRRVLDAACGTGWGTAVLAADAEAVGVDLSPAAIEKARQRHGGCAEFVEGDLRQLPFDDEEFDCVICFEALGHVARPERVVLELRRVLRPQGLLLVSAPNRGVYPPGNPLHASELSSRELHDLLAGHFASVVVHRQQTYFTSLLCDDATLSHRDPEVPIECQVDKLAGGAPGTELHAVAVATDGELPPPPRRLALGGEADYAEQRKQLEEWRERAVRAEVEALALRRKLRGAQE